MKGITAMTPTTRPHRVHPRRRKRLLRRGRAVHLLDIENLTYSTRSTSAQVTTFMNHYRRLVPIGPMDQFVVAVNHSALLAVGTALRGVQLLARSGPDGADQALTEAAYEDRVAQRFDRVVIGSGDGYFAELAAWLAGTDVHVTVVSHRQSLSWRLYITVPDIITLETPTGQAA